MIARSSGSTRYDSDRARWSRLCHMTARQKVYPSLFGVLPDDIRWQDAEHTRADYDEGIDRVAHIRMLSGEVPHTIQERFRMPSYASRRDVTITEFNHASGQPSELYKMRAQWFVYGYFSNDADHIIELLAMPVPSFVSAVNRGAVNYKRIPDNGKGQSFIAIPFDSVLGLNLADMHIRDGQVLFDRLRDFDLADPEAEDVDEHEYHRCEDGRMLFRHGFCSWRYYPPGRRQSK